MKRLAFMLLMSALAHADEIQDVIGAANSALQGGGGLLVKFLGYFFLVVSVLPIIVGIILGYKKMDEAKRQGSTDDPATVFVVTLLKTIAIGYLIVALGYVGARAVKVDPALLIKNVLGLSSTSSATVNIGS